MKFMRIVAMNSEGYFIQETEALYGWKANWKQRIISFEDFIQYMKENFAKEYNEFVESSKTVEEFFYNYGCTDKMIAKGESYIFKANKYENN